MRPRIALTPGDPRGIGPEIAARVCADPALRERVDLTLMGEGPALLQALERFGDPASVGALPGQIRLLDPHAGPSPECAPEVTALRDAVAGCLDGCYDALVTGPISKERLAARGFPWPGHTGYLAHLCGASAPVMTFVSAGLRVCLVTDHVPLMSVPAHLTPERIQRTLRVAAASLTRLYRIPAPRIALCGLNPHAGEHGLLGEEEDRILRPAVARARAEGLDVSGPHPADTVFARALGGAFDLVVALYHDQGLIPVKLLGRGASVHMTWGLPILRTSVDHGTADDIAGQGIADPAGLRAALEEALRLIAHRDRDPGS